MFSLNCDRTNGWVNNRDAGQLRLRRAHHDVTVMRKRCDMTSVTKDVFLIYRHKKLAHVFFPLHYCTRLFVPRSWWRHQMETFSALLALYAGNSPVPVISPHKGQWRGALMFSLIRTWINDWVNNREAGDLRRHRDHYDVIVMVSFGIDRWQTRSFGVSSLTVKHPCRLWINRSH